MRARPLRGAVPLGIAFATCTCQWLGGYESFERDDTASDAEGGEGSSAGSGPARGLDVDDFEDGDTIPTQDFFMIWQCYTYNPPTLPVRCDLENPGYNSNLSQFVEFELQDPMDGGLDYTGAGLRTITVATTLDLTVYRRFVFSSRLTSSDPPLPAGTNLFVRLSCSTVPASGPVDGGFAVFAQVVTGPEWRAHSLELTDFHQPDYQTVRIDPSECLALVDGIDFQIQPTLSDGQAASGKLSIDTVSIQ